MNNTCKTNPLLLPILLVIGLLFASSAWADASQTQDFDANSDGQITFSEVMQTLEKSARNTFDNMDQNKDGVLSDKDFDGMRQGMDKLEDWLHELLKPFIQEDDTEILAL